MRKISQSLQGKIVVLRKLGKSIPEISRETGAGITTVQRYVKNIEVPAKFKAILREKQGGSKERARGLRANINEEISSFIGKMSERDYFFLLAGLYWGEGAKRDFTLINSDPLLVQTFIACLYKVGIPKSRLSFSLRIHREISAESAKIFWMRTTGLPRPLLKMEVIDGKKKGKLPYGMCRVRVRAGIRERLHVQTAIALIGKNSAKKLSSV